MHTGKLHIKASIVVRILWRVGEVYQEMVVKLGVGGGLLSVLFCMEGGDKWCRLYAVGLECRLVKGQGGVDIVWVPSQNSQVWARALI